MANQPFVSNIKEIQRRAREHINNGAVTPGYRGDREQVIHILNDALATELVCVLRYKHHYFIAEGMQAKAVADEFLQHASEEQVHADRLAVRIRQLGGNPNMNPDGLLDRSHSQYHEGGSLVEMIQEDLIAERIAIDSYSEIIRYLGDNDPTSRRLMEDILGQEEEHAEDLASFLVTLDPTKAVA